MRNMDQGKFESKFTGKLDAPEFLRELRSIAGSMRWIAFWTFCVAFNSCGLGASYG